MMATQTKEAIRKELKKNIEKLIDNARKRLFQASNTIAHSDVDRQQDLKHSMQCELQLARNDIEEALEIVQLEL